MQKLSFFSGKGVKRAIVIETMFIEEKKAKEKEKKQLVLGLSHG